MPSRWFLLLLSFHFIVGKKNELAFQIDNAKCGEKLRLSNLKFNGDNNIFRGLSLRIKT